MALEEYLNYHYKMNAMGDLDPQNSAMDYIASRFELNTEQRYWLAFLFGCTYCLPTAYYMINEFPDFENVDINRLQRWWDSNKHKCVFQTDRLRMKTMNLFVPAFQSYRSIIKGSQSETFRRLMGGKKGNPDANYEAVLEHFSNIKYFGRFTMFIYLEAVEVLTGINISPSELDVANALSSRNGLCYALGFDSLIDARLSKKQVEALEAKFKALVYKVKNQAPYGAKLRESAWGVETSLCAFKKYKRGDRWLGYYIDRQAEEIIKLESAVTEGVNWKPLWQYREENFEHKYLMEKTGAKSTRENPYETVESDFDYRRARNWKDHYHERGYPITEGKTQTVQI